MRRLVTVLALLAGAAAGAYAQNQLVEETQPSSDVFQIGVLYGASFCGGGGLEWQYGSRPRYAFFLRPTRPLSDGWIEAEVAYQLTYDSAKRASFVPGKKPSRINSRQLCEVTVAELNR